MNESMNQEKETKKVDEETSVASENNKKKPIPVSLGVLSLPEFLYLSFPSEYFPSILLV